MKKIVIAFLLLFCYHSSQETMIRVVNSDSKVESKPLSIEMQLFNTLVAHNIDTVMAKILIAQASFESGRFKNKLTKDHSNVFSIMHSSKRKTLSLGPYGHAEGRDGYCSYMSKDSSAVDMILYMDARKFPKDFKTIGAYCKYLKKRSYFEDNVDIYTTGVRARYREIWVKKIQQFVAQ